MICILLLCITQDDEDLTELLCEEDTETPFQMVESEGSDSYNALLKLYTFFLLMFQSLFWLSDTALNVFLVFFFSTLGSTVATIPQAFVSNLPRHVRSARIIAGSTRNSLQQFVCCPACHSIYKPDDCIMQLSSGEIVSQKCTFRMFPSHPQLQHRGKCNNLLMKRLKLSSGKVSLQPRLVYSYKNHCKKWSNEKVFKRNVRHGEREKC